MIFSPSLAPLLGALAFALALAFRRYRAAQVLVLLTLAMILLGGVAGGVWTERGAASVPMFLPWLLLLAIVVPEPPLRSRRMAAFVLVVGLSGVLIAHAPAHVWDALRDALPLGGGNWRVHRVAATLALLAALLSGARWLRRSAPLDAGLTVALVFVASGFLDVLGIGLAGWLMIAALTGACAVIYASWRLAFLDALTGLPNRRALDETLARLSGNYALAMVDVDHFKQFNDKHGHDAGDRVLVEVGRALAHTRGAAAFRFGGEEFCLLFRRPELAAPACEEARQRIEAMTVRLPRKRSGKKPANEKSVNVGVTASIGVADRGATLRAASDVLKAADQRLYRAKGKGRNQVVAKG